MSTGALLDGRHILVVGGTGNVGRHVVRALLGLGATVVVPSRSNEKRQRLLDQLAGPEAGRVVTVLGDVGDDLDAPRVREEVLEQVPYLDGVIATLGRFTPAPSLLDASVAELRTALDDYLVAHFVVARTFLPVVRKGGSYLFVNGALAFRPLFPGVGLVSVVTAAQAMLAQVVMKEQGAGAVRINEVILYTSFGGGDDAPVRGPVSQEEVATYIALLSSDRGAGITGQTIHLDRPEPLERLAPHA
jgi:NAD(P)-dependent dehydrogenase (short-subunit alcohol dehydrogenase family)